VGKAPHPCLTDNRPAGKKRVFHDGQGKNGLDMIRAMKVIYPNPL
jgi:hypothetical protein